MNQFHHLALLIAAPQAGESAMYRDLTAMAQALQGRGFSADQILCLHGRLDRPLVVAFLQAASRRVAAWAVGSVFVHVSGHGFFDGETADETRPGLLFGDTEDATDDDHLFWDGFFAALALPAGVRLTLLPDL
ncbi:MAG: hypothetical protein NT169_28135 [Chloroflexi bacterium]|nr:hypothetical protein [Chloroflexota bacterium]